VLSKLSPLLIQIGEKYPSVFKKLL